MRILGLDIGTTSIGFALVDLDKSRSAGSILRLGVRIFPEARDPDGTPLNQQRRAKRMMRRQLRRRRERRRSLNELLASSDLLPAYGGDRWRDVMKLDPYALRAKGLSEPLTPHEFGRALYHLSKRRHFKERDLAEIGESETAPASEETVPAKPRGKAKAAPKDGEPNDEAKSTEARKHFVAELKASGQTLGQALAARSSDVKRRGEHATRAIVEEEFSRLVAAQAPGHAILRDAAFLGAVHEAIFAQRPVFWRKSTLGKCRFVPDAPLCPKGSWLSQQRRMLEKVNNLALLGGNARRLDPEERNAILATLQKQKSMSWSGVRDALKPIFKARGEGTKTLHFNLETGDEKGGLKGNIVEADLAKVFGARWEQHPRKDDLRTFVPEALWQADYGEIGAQRVVIRPEKERASRREVLARQLIEDFGANEAEAAAIVKLHFPQGWEPFSTEALRRFLPKLEERNRFGEFVRFGELVNGPDFESWRSENFPQREQPTGEILDRLPSPRGDARATPEQREEARRIAGVRNPTVVRVQNEMRKVVNNLIGLHGKPDLIRVELARDVGKSKREREKISAGMRKKEGLRKRARADLIANEVADPKDDDIEKWLLWTESGERCPYTGDEIGFADLFSGNPHFEVEHIRPRSKSLDNSLRNKTLCRKDVNLAKGNRIPFEFFRGRPDDWQAAKDRVWKMTGKDRMTEGKAKRFCAEAMPDDFAGRQLNDTGYAARQAMAFLKRLWPDVGATAPANVQAVTGKVTAQLRRRWGLNHILADDGEKTRDDHRHHAIDAFVVACADGGYTLKLSRYFEAESDYRRGRGAKPSDAIVDPPWANIRADVERAVAGILVSHRVRKKVSGPLHKDMIFGDTKEDVLSGRTMYRLIVRRVPIADLSMEDIQADEITSSKYVVRDLAVRRILREHLANFGGDLKKAMATPPRMGASGPDIRKVKLMNKRQVDGLEPMHNGLSDPEAKHHVAIFRMPDGTYKPDIVSLFDAAKRIARRLPIVRRQNEDGGILIMSLSKGDMLTLRDPRAPYWVVRELKSNGQVTLVPHTEARPTKQAIAFKPTIPGLMKLNPGKVSVDPIGRVRAAND